MLLGERSRRNIRYVKSNQTHGPTLDDTEKRGRAELLAEVDRIRAMTQPRKAGATYPTAEQLIRDERDAR
jgi:hypothetical protein